jgi:hypothetical protein
MGCREASRPEAPPAQASTSSNRLAPATGAVLPTQAGRTLLRQCTRSTPWGVVGFWSPPRDVIDEIEALLPAVLDSVFRRAPRSPEQSAYYRQYTGITRWTGKHTVYVNAFHREHLDAINGMRWQISGGQLQPAAGADTMRWRTSPVSVCDGGLMFWGIEYDPGARRFGRLEFNDR